MDKRRDDRGRDEKLTDVRDTPEGWLRRAKISPRGDVPIVDPKPPGFGGGLPDGPEVEPEPDPPSVEVEGKEYARLKAIEASIRVMDATATSGNPVPLTGYAGPTPEQYNKAKDVLVAALAAAPPPSEPPVDPDAPAVEPRVDTDADREARKPAAIRR